MTTNLLPFNDDDSTLAPSARTLIVGANAGRPLDKKAQAFNRLLAKVHALEARFEREKRRLDDALIFHAAEVRPRLERVAGLRKDVVRALQPFLDDLRLKERDRRILADILAGQLDEILEHDESPGQDLRQLFERLHGIDLSDVVQEQIDEAKAAMAEIFAGIGLDMEVPDLRADMSEEEVAATVAQMADRMRQLDQDARFAGEPLRRKTKREMKEEARAQQFERLRKIGIGGIYKRLAKGLHPDLEPDAALRERKSALMQKVTAAYARNDVHALLRLELEWMGGDHLGASPMTEETLQAYTALLKQQVAELEAACVELPFHPRYEALLDADLLGLPSVIDGPAEVRRLDLVIDGLTRAVQRMAAGQALREVRNLIQEHRRAARRRPSY